MKKRGFALVAAIFFIIIVATIAVTTLSTATMTARDTVNLHAKEQAFLLAQSATEFAIMAMQTHNYPDVNASGVRGNCLEQINLTYPTAQNPLYNITVNLYYLNRQLGCTATNMIGATNLNDTRTPGAHMALVDVTVRSTGNLGSIPITYNRRTLQKP